MPVKPFDEIEPIRQGVRPFDEIEPMSDVQGIKIPGVADPQDIPRETIERGLTPPAKEGQGFVQTTAEELTGRKLVKKTPFLGSALAGFENIELIGAANRLKKGFDYSQPIIESQDLVGPQYIPGQLYTRTQPVYSTREQDIELVKNFLLEQEKKYTFGGRVAQGLTVLPKWFIEFAATGGLESLGNKTAQEIGKKILKDYAKTKTGQLALRAAGWTGGAAARTVGGLGTTIFEKGTERQAEVATGLRKQENLVTSFAKAFGDTYIEALSEEAGETITGGLAGGSKWLLSKTKLGRQFIDALEASWKTITGGTHSQFINQIATRAGYSNIIGEIGEERLGTILRAITNVEDYDAGPDSNMFQRLWKGMQNDWENIGVEAVVLGVPMATKLAATREFREPPPAMPIDMIKPQKAPGKVKKGALTVYQSIFNRFASIENLTQRAEALGLRFKPGENPTLRARTYLGSGRKAESILADSTYRITPEGEIEITGEGLRPILFDYENTFKTDIPEIKLDEAEKDLQDFLKAQRTIEDLQRPAYEGGKNIATPKQVRESEQRLQELQDKYGDKVDLFNKTAQRLYDFQNRVLWMLVDSGNLSRKQYLEIVEKNRHYVPFDRIMEEYGLEETVKGGTPRTTKPFTEARNPLRKIRGSEREIQNIVESIIKNTYRITDIAERNTTARSIMRLQQIFPEEIQPLKIQMRPIRVNPRELSTIIKTFRSQSRPIVEEATEETRRYTSTGEEAPISGPMEKLKKVVREALMKRGMTEGEAGNYIRKIEQNATGGKAPTSETIEKTIKQIVRQTQETIIKEEPIETTIFRPSQFKPAGKNVIEYFEDGKRRYAQVTDNLYEAMAGLNETSSGLLVKVLSQPASWLRVGATITPEFMLRNPMRDTQVALLQTSFGFVPGVDTVKAVADILKKSDAYYDWLRSGGAYSGFVELSRRQLRKAYKTLMRKKGLLKRLNVITSAQDISQLGEQATRLAVFKKAKAAGKTAIEAGYQSREATVDFGRRGSKTKSVNAITAFLNAGLQGVDKTARQMLRNPLSTSAKAMALVTIPSLLLYLRNRKDPDYAEQPRWMKDLFFMTKVPGTDTYVRIPKPFLYGQVFGSLPERFFEYVDTKDPKAFDDFAMTLVDSALPTQGDPTATLLATALKPLIENATNYNFFTQKPIVPESVEDLEPAEQFTQYTTETAKKLGKILNYSPSKIENLVTGWTGGSGKYALQMGDLLVAQIEKSDKQEKAKDITTKPLIKGFTARSAAITGQGESVTKFYKNYKKIDAQQKTFKRMVRQGRREEALKYKKKHPDLNKAKIFRSRAAQMTKINRSIERINNSKQLSDKAKNEKVKILQRRKLKLAKITNALLD